jgi:transposase
MLEVERRHYIGGESLNSLAKEFGVNESTLRRKVKPNKAEAEKPAKSLIQLANEKAASDKEAKRIAEEIAELPISRQQIVSDLTRRLVSISGHVAGAAEFSAATSHRIAAIANAQAERIDDADPTTGDSMEALRTIAALTDLANKAAVIPTALLAAHKETIKDMNQQAKPLPARVTVTVEDASVPDA